MLVINDSIFDSVETSSQKVEKYDLLNEIESFTSKEEFDLLELLDEFASVKFEKEIEEILGYPKGYTLVRTKKQVNSPQIKNDAKSKITQTYTIKRCKNRFAALEDLNIDDL